MAYIVEEGPPTPARKFVYEMDEKKCPGHSLAEDVRAWDCKLCWIEGIQKLFKPREKRAKKKREKPQTWRETIQCPKCYEVENAVVEHRPADTFPIYVHKCKCGYIITESEWEKVVI